MLKRLVCASVFLASPATAQVVLIGSPPSDAIISVGSPRASVASSSISDIDARMAGAFNGFGAPKEASQSAPRVIPAVAQALVPHWMRAGAASPFSLGAAGPIFSVGEIGPCVLPAVPAFRVSEQALQRRSGLRQHIAEAACSAGIPANLLDALVHQESRYDAMAVSRAGAMGLAQIMPATTRELGLRHPFDARANLIAGARYLRMQFDAFGRYDLALAAYNAGPGRVRRHNGIPPIRETTDYVRTILASWMATTR